MFETFLRLDFGPGNQIIAYADDAAILIHGNSRVELERKAEHVIHCVSGWSAKAKLTFLQPKTQLLMLKGNSISPNDQRSR